MTARRIVANLDAEDDLAATWAAERGLPHRRPAWSRQALATASAAGTLLRALARDGDRLHLPAAIEPVRLADVPGLPQVQIESGPLPKLAPTEEVLAWCETVGVAALRRHGLAPRFPWDPALPLHEALWRLPAAPPSAVAAANHRGFCLAVAKDLGCALPGACLVSSLAELQSRIDEAPAGSPLAHAWIVKAPFSAAGRSRYVERSGRLDPANRRRIEGLFARHGALLLEPWMERTADFGLAAILSADGVYVVGLHRQSVDLRGQFAGLELGVEREDSAGLNGEERETLLRVVSAVGERLRGLGYLGPFGIDAWRYRRADGSEAFHPLGEINARMTIGLLARALVERLCGPLGVPADERVRLRFGRLPRDLEGLRPASLVPLCLPEDGGSAVWVESPCRASERVGTRDGAPTS
ncbi:MAG TPA: hypothetical protein VGE98_04025 [Thermoanaerobaculia bacterium]